MKPVVHYRKVDEASVIEGHSAVVWPVDHPSRRVSNTTYAYTSAVVSVKRDESGDVIGFETMNTIYEPVPIVQES